MSSLHDRIEEVFQQTDSGVLALRAVPGVNNTYKYSVQLVERQAAEMARTLYRVRSQLEHVAHDVAKNSVNAEVAKHEFFKLASSRFTYSNGTGSTVLPLSPLKQVFDNLESSCLSEDEQVNVATYEHKLSTLNLPSVSALLSVQMELFKFRLDRLAKGLSYGSDRDL